MSSEGSQHLNFSPEAEPSNLNEMSFENMKTIINYCKSTDGKWKIGRAKIMLNLTIIYDWLRIMDHVEKN